MSPLLSSNPLVDLDCLVQDLVEVCRSPSALSEPDVGRATLALSAATTLFARAAQTRAEVSRAHAGIEEAFRHAQEALARARDATERSRLSRQRARTLIAGANALRPAAEGTVPLLRAWTTARSVRVACTVCRGPVTVRYQYRFMEGLAPTELRCPRGTCAGVIAFCLPVNSFGLSVTAAE